MKITYLFVVLVFLLSSCLEKYEKIQRIDNEFEVGLENESLFVSFDKKTGELCSIINKVTKDNYIKKPGAGNIFRLYVDTDSMPELVAGAHDCAYGGIVIEPSSSKFETYKFLDKDNSRSLILRYSSKETSVKVVLEIELSDTTQYFDCHLTVINAGDSPVSIYTAFPYLSGICLGNDPGTNLAVNMWDRGYPGIKAWEKPLGGVYGRNVSMQWQCVYEPALKEGLAFIAMDTHFKNKILTCFPEGGMTSLYFDKKNIEKGTEQKWPSSRIIVYTGNWRTAALEYSNWFSANIKTRSLPAWYRSEVTKRSSAWFPPKENVILNKKSRNKTLITSFEQMYDMFKGTYNDCMEFAMWNEDVNLWPETYGPWMSSGFIDFRSDLGGVSAFRKGLETCHRYGRRVAMYVAGYGARKESPMFEGRWQHSAIMINKQGDYDKTYSSDTEVYGAFNCPGYKPWKDNIIRVCTMLAETGVDEIRLDEIGFPFRPCFNPEHNHESPYDCNKWMMDFLQEIREATYRINPELVITTEFFMDYFNISTNGALVMDCPGNEIDAMKIALPGYLPLSYHASASEAAITGAIMSKIDSRRNNWAWANIGTEKPVYYDEDFVRNLAWHVLYPTFAEAVTYGKITDWDPIALNDTKWMGHLWKAKDFWVLTGGHVDATPLKVEYIKVKLPELPSCIEKAYEFNIETLEMHEAEICRIDNEITILLKSPVSAVLLPLPSCPPLPIIEQKQIVSSESAKIEVKVSLFAPWRVSIESNGLSSIKLTAPGFKVTDSIDKNIKTFTIHVSDDTPDNDFYYTITGDCLNAKRWFNMLVMCTSKDPAMKAGLKMYVSTNGNDNWSGMFRQPNRDKTDGPFATIEGARNTIRILKETKNLPEGNVIVEIQKGSYELLAPFELEARDSGEDSLSRIIYLGHNGSEVRLTGSMNLPNWELVKDKNILEKLSVDVRDKVYQTNLMNSGINDFGSPAGGGIELFFNDIPMWISRYPNKGFVRITGLLNEEPVEIHGIKGDKAGKFNYNEHRIDLWKEEKDAWVHGYWFWDWSEERHKILSIDTGKKIIEVAPPYHYYGYREGQWFYGFNLLSEIDEPGEYYIDREEGILYFYPPSDIEKGNAYVSLSGSIINISKVSNLTIQGIVLEGCRETAVKIQDCNNISIRACTIRNVGDWAVTIDGGNHNGVKDCDIYNAGGGGIRIDAGDRKTLIPAKCFADNNYIHHIARIKRGYNPGISLYGAGNYATHNLIAHVPHMAIYFNGNDHLMEFNEIHDVCYESNDAGAVYAGRSWTMRGNIFRYNYLYDISGLDGKGCIGVYLDDMFCGTEIYGNVFNRVTRAAMIGGGRDNSVINNIFIDCVPSIHVDARGLGWYAAYVHPLHEEAEFNSTISGIIYNKPPYSTRYPQLLEILNDEPAAPKGNIISLNVCSGGNWDKAAGYWDMSIEDKARPYLIMENNVVSPGSEVEDSLSNSLIIADPLFSNKANPEQGKFKLDANSPAIKRGFKQIPFDKIGLYKNKYRTSISLNE